MRFATALVALPNLTMCMLCFCSEVEVKLEGGGPWVLPDGGTDVELIHTPGHTTGHVVFLHKPDHALLSGDHWGYSGREQCGSLFRWGLLTSCVFC